MTGLRKVVTSVGWTVVKLERRSDGQTVDRKESNWVEQSVGQKGLKWVGKLAKQSERSMVDSTEYHLVGS
jgi:hypothetical protein